MILNDNLLESSISIKYLRDWLDNQEKGKASYVQLRINDISQENEDEFEDLLINLNDGSLILEKIQLEAV